MRKSHRRNIFSICRECKVRNNDSSRKRLIRCRYCGEYFCTKHIHPSLMMMRAGIERIKDPILRDKFEQEWRKTNGHPDARWTEKYITRINFKHEEDMRKFNEFLDKSKQQETYSEYTPQVYKSSHSRKVYNNSHHYKPQLQLPKIRFSNFSSNPFAWYVIYVFVIGVLTYLTYSNQNLYFLIAPIVQYPLYIVSAFLGGYIPYRLFKHFEYQRPRSDLQIWFWKILSGIFLFASLIILYFGVVFVISSALANVGKELGYSIAIFFGILFAGITLLSSYLLFKYKTKSGVIIHRGEW